MNIFCVECQTEINCKRVTGKEVYPHRKDLFSLVFWKCPECGNFVGTHKNSKDNAPLGIIANQELKNARKHIHELLDPIWKEGGIKRKDLYNLLSNKLGWEYHTAKIRNIAEARKVYRTIKVVIIELLEPEINPYLADWEKEIKCKYLECAWGMGVAGRGECAGGGNMKSKNCRSFEEDSE